MAAVIGLDVATEGAAVELDRETGRALSAVRWYGCEQFSREYFEVRYLTAGGRLRRERIPRTTVRLGWSIGDFLGAGKRHLAFELPATGRGPAFNFQTTRSLLLRAGGLATMLEVAVGTDEVQWIEPSEWRREVLGLTNRWLRRPECKEAALNGGAFPSGRGKNAGTTLVPEGGVRAIVPGLADLIAVIGGAIDVCEAAAVAEARRRRLGGTT